MEEKKKWSRNWEYFDWEPVRHKLSEAEANKTTQESFDIGISMEEIVEYFEWLRENKPSEFFKFVVMRVLEENGL